MQSEQFGEKIVLVIIGSNYIDSRVLDRSDIVMSIFVIDFSTSYPYLTIKPVSKPIIIFHFESERVRTLN